MSLPYLGDRNWGLEVTDGVSLMAAIDLISRINLRSEYRTRTQDLPPDRETPSWDDLSRISHLFGFKETKMTSSYVWPLTVKLAGSEQGPVRMN